jgi:hypothetical protein
VKITSVETLMMALEDFIAANDDPGDGGAACQILYAVATLQSILNDALEGLNR